MCFNFTCSGHPDALVSSIAFWVSIGLSLCIFMVERTPLALLLAFFEVLSTAIKVFLT